MQTVRPLSPEEEALLRHLLSEDFEGAPALRQQIPQVEVIGPWEKGSASIKLRVPDHVRRASLPDGPLPVDAWAFDESRKPLGTLLVWAKDGRIAAIEYGWVTNEMPGSLPSAATVGVRPSAGDYFGRPGTEGYRFPERSPRL